MRSVNVVVRGRVQGVGFRWFTQEAAQEHDVTGWVRNRRDGAVEAELHGTQVRVEAVIEAMAQGPSGAWVDEITVADAGAASPNGFEIRATA